MAKIGRKGQDRKTVSQAGIIQCVTKNCAWSMILVYKLSVKFLSWNKL